MSISFVKYTVMGNDRAFNLPRADVDALYGPGWPISPLPRPEETPMPRVVDYPIGVNYNPVARGGWEGLMPVPALTAAYQNVTEVRNPVGQIARMLPGFRPMLQDVKTKNQVKDGHPYDWMTKSPDRKTPFVVWFSRFIKSNSIYASPAIYLHRDSGGHIDGMEYIDGSTLMLIINSRGVLPEPDEVDPEILQYLQRIKYGLSSGDMRVAQGMPELARLFLERQQARKEKGLPLVVTTPAFLQIIKGTPMSFWDKSQIWYVPQSPTTNTPYGESFIEAAWTWVNIIAVVTAFELGFYKTGNTPEGLLAVPKDWFPSMGKLAVGETVWNNRMTGALTQMTRMRFVPEGTQYTPTKKADFPKALYDQAKENIAFALGFTPTMQGDKPGGGLGGKGFETGAAHDFTNQVLEPNKKFYETPFNDVLKRDGVNDVEFVLDYPQEEIDPAVQAQNRWQGLIHGDLTLNDALSQQGKQPIGKPDDPENIANMHMLTVGNSIYVVEKMNLDPTGMAIPVNTQPGQAGGSPIGPEDAVLAEHGGDGHTPVDNKTLQDALRQLELTAGKSVSKTTYSLPTPVLKVAQPEAIALTDLIYHKGDMVSIDPAEFEAGMKEEQEHAETVGNDQAVIRQIVLDHLREDPHYYSHLKDAGLVEKVDIVHDGDGGMIAIFIPLEIAAKLRKIADSIGLPKDAEQEIAENMHVTLAYVPDEKVLQDNNTVLSQVLRKISAEYPILKGKIQGYGVFNGEDDKHVLYATLDVPELPFLRTAICEALDELHIEYGKEHGFVPHITLAYFTNNWQIPEGFMVPDMPVEIEAVVTCIGDKRWLEQLGKLQKHCGVCPEDAEYFNAPVSREVHFEFPKDHHANDLEIVAMSPDGLPPQPALWKPEGGEKESLNASIGGNQYLREEAAYLLDRSLGFHLVPVAYVAEANGERGAALWYTSAETEDGRLSATKIKPINEYAPLWTERAAVLDYIASQQDRPANKNFLTHPDEPDRMILIDNGYSFPNNPAMYAQSVFAAAMDGKALQPETLRAIQLCVGDAATWADIRELVGDVATEKALGCAKEILARKRIVLG